MSFQYTPVTTSQYVRLSKQWMEAIDHGDHLAIMFFRMTDRLRRIQQFIEEFNLKKKPNPGSKEYVFLVLDSLLHNHTLEDQEDLLEHLTTQLNYKNFTSQKKTFQDWLEYFQKNNIKLILVIPQAELLHDAIGRNVILWLHFLIQTYDPYICIMSFYEIDIAHPDKMKMFEDIANFEQRIEYYPLYSEEDTLIFINYLQKKWNLELSSKQVKEIFSRCGGHFWFVKEAIRQIRDTGSWSTETSDMQYRLRTMYQMLAPSEQSVLQKLISKQQALVGNEEHSLEYFRKMGFIDESGNFKVPLVENYLLNRHDKVQQLVVKNGSIVYNNLPLDKFFSPKEYGVLKLLLEKSNQIVSRDEIAQTIWSDSMTEGYSDWAIDQIITRLRRRLQELLLSPEVIKTVRKKGYKLIK